MAKSKTKTSSVSEKSKTTTDHATIRQWAEERDGRPARVKSQSDREGTNKGFGVLRIDFGKPESNLEVISWEAFFDIFDENDLAFLYQETIDGALSRFFKFVDRASTAQDIATAVEDTDEDIEVESDEDEETEDKEDDAAAGAKSHDAKNAGQDEAKASGNDDDGDASEKDV